ncbi:MAG: hypothetical protein KAX49_13745 [Halanaerobiales bacterium]|nr:hypothetical protein [Halanaerobiales bacterium]
MRNNKLCSVCLKDYSFIEKEVIKSTDINFYNYLETFNLLLICKDCFEIGFKLYKEDISNFMDWLDENDNRIEETDDNVIRSLRNNFNISEELLMDNPDLYIDELSKYIISLENKIKSDIQNAYSYMS